MRPMPKRDANGLPFFLKLRGGGVLKAEQRRGHGFTTLQHSAGGAGPTRDTLQLAGRGSDAAVETSNYGENPRRTMLQCLPFPGALGRALAAPWPHPASRCSHPITATRRVPSRPTPPRAAPRRAEPSKWPSLAVGATPLKSTPDNVRNLQQRNFDAPEEDCSTSHRHFQTYATQNYIKVVTIQLKKKNNCRTYLRKEGVVKLGLAPAALLSTWPTLGGRARGQARAQRCCCPG